MAHRFSKHHLFAHCVASSYKVVHEETAVSVADLNLQLADSRTRSAHNFKFKVQRANTSELKNFFTVRTVPVWNSLPATVVEASSTASFEAQLAKVARD